MICCLVYSPIGSMYGIFTNIGPKHHPDVGKYTIHGAYGPQSVGAIFVKPNDLRNHGKIVGQNTNDIWAHVDS